MGDAGGLGRSDVLRGVTVAKQFPNDAEPFRGSFTLEQLRATRGAVEWRVIAPIPWAPRWLSRLLRRPYVSGSSGVDGIPVDRPRYPVLPRRLLYTLVAPAMALSSRPSFRRIVESHEPQFVHAHAIYPSAAAARRLVGSSGLPLIVSVHGSDLHTNLVRPAWAREVRATLAAADAVICVSSALARDVNALGCVDPDRVVVVPNTIDISRFDHVDREPHEGPVRLVSVGNLVPVKGHDILLRALGMAVRSGLDVTLDLVGGGSESQNLAALAAEEGLTDRVRFLGPLSAGALTDALARADAFVLASRQEGFGVAIVEALATGLPVVTTRSGGPEDIVGDDDGVLVEAGDPAAFAAGISELMASLGSRDSHAIASRARERYAPATVGRRLVTVYTSVLEQRARRGGTSDE
ncbi:MAG: glycosyltransferase [Coriobacteriia bacterium]